MLKTPGSHARFLGGLCGILRQAHPKEPRWHTEAPISFFTKDLLLENEYQIFTLRPPKKKVNNHVPWNLGPFLLKKKCHFPIIKFQGIFFGFREGVWLLPSLGQRLFFHGVLRYRTWPMCLGPLPYTEHQAMAAFPSVAAGVVASWFRVYVYMHVCTEDGLRFWVHICNNCKIGDSEKIWLFHKAFVEGFKLPWIWRAFGSKLQIQY